MKEFRKIFGTAIAAAMLTALPFGASALTINITDNSGGGTSISVADGGCDAVFNTICDESAADGVVSLSGVVLGEATFDLTSAVEFDAFGVSGLSMGLTNGVSGSGDLDISVSHNGYGEGAGDPTGLAFSLTPTYLVGASSLDGEALYDNGNVEFAGTLLAPGETLTSASDSIHQTGSATLNDPFSLTINTSLAAGSATTFDATILAAVPVPAAGLMLVGALGGLAALRRRRKAA